jgi:hypothetical protein
VIERAAKGLGAQRADRQMSNVFQESLEAIADRRFSENPQLLIDMWHLRRRLQSGHFDRGLVNAFVQTYTGKYDLYDTFGFAMLWSALVKGKMCYAIVEIDHECYANKAVATNRAILSGLALVGGPDGSKVRCEADFWGGLADCDGYFRWLDPLRFQRHLGDDQRIDSSARQFDTLTVEKGQLPLEVGTTLAGTTYGHIFTEGGLARWPYHSKQIYVFYAPLTGPGVVSFCNDEPTFNLCGAACATSIG